MLFNSFQFLVFFPVVTTLFFVLPHRFRWVLLLGASCVFYMAFVPAYILILLFTIVIDYWAGMLIEAASGPRRKLYLALSLGANLGVLGVFKYYNFFSGNVSALLHWGGSATTLPVLHLLLPIGLSFHTFQAMSYTIEVYRGRQQAERHLGLYALYVLFYPQLVAGPIERPQHMLPQFRQKQYFDYDRVVSGLRLMAWGLFKKMVIADRLARLVNEVYDAPTHYRGLPLLVATVFFSVQIYCDFSGYSDIARGSARVMGFELMQNFNRPYFSRSLPEFWRRWHISLSTWFRDYLYIPLGGSRVALPRVCVNLFIVFLLSGLWHGANWTFLIWGALHGTYLVVGLLTRTRRRKLAERLPLLGRPALNVAFTYGLVVFAWIFFRANSLPDAHYIVRHLFGASAALREGTLSLGLAAVKVFYQRYEWLSLAGALLALVLVETAQARMAVGGWVARQPTPVRWALYYSIVLGIALLSSAERVQFIYFQF
ncbi:MBOAT family O-acyltransferase [Hymenobacter negativus]|uniref:MBOAT family protein n=1 Tax=Hymenobacter negativus TaxID=2795026 RepID=A0ABS0QBN8_9BACT|nr:MBOAT family protein [Hymenobacter negativus]MBH8560012.1 MBOAT family protein [Hymenobacter negativus]